MSDLISRKAVLREIKAILPDGWHGRLEHRIMRLSTQPRKKGRWIEKDDCWDGIYYECSVCKDAFTLVEGTPSDNNYNFCPNCGSYNGGEEE